jgi:hypothetical protein
MIKLQMENILNSRDFFLFCLTNFVFTILYLFYFIFLIP